MLYPVAGGPTDAIGHGGDCAARSDRLGEGSWGQGSSGVTVAIGDAMLVFAERIPGDPCPCYEG